MKDILFFSHNQKKIVEVKQIFKDSKIKVYDLNTFEKRKSECDRILKKHPEKQTKKHDVPFEKLVLQGASRPSGRPF